MYAVDQPARPADSCAEHGALVDAVARGDAERARTLAAQLAERAGAAHRLRRPARPATVPRVRDAQRAVNTTGGRN